MGSVLTIREHLEKYLQSEQITLNSFAAVSGINSGTLSNILNKHKPISVGQLDRITGGMALPEGHFYELYIDECFSLADPDWRRLGPFLQRCADLNKIEIIEEVIQLMMDNLGYIPLLFTLAEEFFAAGKSKAAELIYECVAESEKLQHSERLALCQYRLFTLRLCNNQRDNLLLAAQFEYFVDRLEECYQLDALKELINAFGALKKWDKVLVLADKLKVKSTIHYELYRSKKDPSTKKEIVYYIQYAYLSLGTAHFYLGNYDKALEFVAMYNDDSWVINPNESEIEILQQFQEWAEGNRYMYKLRAGQIDVLPEYLKYIDTREREVFAALCEIVDVANLYSINIDHILEKYTHHVELKPIYSKFGQVNKQFVNDRYVHLLSSLAIYHFNDRPDEAFQYLLHSLKLAIDIGDGKGMLKCIRLFENHRDLASDEAVERYKILLNEVSDDEETISFARSSV
ncbi:transcriptional regulator [Paenibacillus hubeiensis]|uniref:transcriptional regulator n=1 Tax=Paenibacillus hubeiensis TaxID=3077330 RepID=UPI0031BB056A